MEKRFLVKESQPKNKNGLHDQLSTEFVQILQLLPP